MKLGTVAILFAFAVAATAQEGWARFRVYPQTQAEVERIANSTLGLFSEDIGIPETDLIVGPGELPKLRELGLRARWISDLPNPLRWEERYPSLQDDFTNQYLRYDNIIAQYEMWRAQYPAQVSRTQIATTANGRAVWAYRLFAPGKQGTRTAQKAVLSVFGTHAREWISPALGLNLFNNLVSLLINGPANTGMPDGVEYLFVPVLNPDGYEYCWTNNRMWRKNRRNNGNGSFGVDLNRNYSTAWGLNSGSSSNPSSETYRGTAPFSEPETNGLRNYLNSRPPVTSFVDYHSYGQLILWAWGYTTTPAPGNAWMSTIGNIVRNAMIDAGGLPYVAGQSSTTLYLVSGGSKDYFYERYDCPSYTIELRDTGQNGFLLPESEIQPTVAESWAGFLALVKNMHLR